MAARNRASSFETDAATRTCLFNGLRTIDMHTLAPVIGYLVEMFDVERVIGVLSSDACRGSVMKSLKSDFWRCRYVWIAFNGRSTGI